MILILMVDATLTSVRTCTPTLSCPVAPPCTPVLPTECRRRSLPSPHPPSRSRLPPRGSTPYGSVAPSSPPCPPSNRCGSPSRSTTSAAHPLSTASASKCFILNLCYGFCFLLHNRLVTIENGLKSLTKQLLSMSVG